MTNLTVITIYLPLVAMSLVIIALGLSRDKHLLLTRNLIYLNVCVLCWLVSAIAYFATPSFTLSRFLYDVKLPFISLAALQVFEYVMRFYSMDHYLGKTMRYMLLIIPILTGILVLASPYHNFIRSSFEVIATEPMHIVSQTRGLWYWVHAAYSYVLSIACVFLVLFQHRKLPKQYRGPSRMIVIGIFVSLTSNIIVLAGVLNVPFDISLIGISISAVFIYFANVNNREMLYVMNARNSIFDYLSQGVLLLGGREDVVEMNPAAKQMLRSRNVDINEKSYHNILAALYGSVTEFNGTADDEDGIDFTWRADNATDEQVVYNLKEKEITDTTGRVIGIFAIFEDVSQNRTLIHHLENDAGVDALTGLFNRRQMERIKQELESVEYLPVAVIMADVDGLKRVNDTFGHQQGDVYLRLAAEVLESCCPPSGYLGRLGGDEFCMYLPRSSAKQAEGIVNAVQMRMRVIFSYPFRPSISMGYAIKDAPTQNIDAIQEQADIRMYRQKTRKR
ncbi:diguanylate cyclase [Eubacteriales bacterium OttesenSCG-928-N14]|nr:diguanylate cyclase [Eubacteriales bacterium OttesenSCG-928-N14]